MIRALFTGLTFLVLLLILTFYGEAADHGVDLEVNLTEKNAEPGETTKFEVMVNNTGNLTDNFELTIFSDERQWSTFQETGNDHRNFTLGPGQIIDCKDCGFSGPKND